MRYGGYALDVINRVRKRLPAVELRRHQPDNSEEPDAHDRLWLDKGQHLFPPIRAASR